MSTSPISGREQQSSVTNVLTKGSRRAGPCVRHGPRPRAIIAVKLGFIGCDRTAAILARGLDEQVLFAGTDGARAAALAAALGGRVLSSYEAVAERADVVFLCHGPSEMASIAAAVAPHARILVSAVAGTSLGVVRRLSRFSGVPDRRQLGRADPARCHRNGGGTGACRGPLCARAACPHRGGDHGG